MAEEKKDVKTCPLCGEEILAVAIRCKHCGGDLAALGKQDQILEIINSLKNNTDLNTLTNIHFVGDIPEDKIARAKKKYANAISPTEKILVLGENKIAYAHLCGFIITNKNFYYFGVNEYSNPLAGSRMGVVPIGDIHSFQLVDPTFGDSHFVLNGLDIKDSKLIPKFFTMATKTDDNFIKSIIDAIIMGEVSPSTASSFPSVTPSSPSVHKSKNPLEAGAAEKKGCFKSGCKGTFKIIAIVAAVLFLAVLAMVLL